MSEIATNKPGLNIAGGKFIVSSRSLAKALEPLTMNLNYSTVLPILECVLIEVNGFRLKLTTTDLETTLIKELDIDSRNDFSFCVDCKLLYKFCKDLPDQPIVFDYTKSASLLKIKGDDLTAKFTTEEAGNFPKVPVIEEDMDRVYEWKFGYNIFMQPLGMALGFKSNDELRPSMTGIYLHDHDGKLKMAATDAHRLYYTNITERTPSLMKGIAKIFPAKPSRLMVKYFKKDDDISISLVCTDSHAFFKQHNLTCITRFIDARYPDYQMVIPKPEAHLYFRRKDLQVFLKLALLFSNKSTNQLEICIEEGEVKCKSEDIDFGFGMDFRLKAFNANKNINVKFGINAKFMLEMTGVVKDEYVKLSTMEEYNKAIIFDDCILIMPLMINK